MNIVIKTSLYVCGGLMSVAVVLGAIDLNKAEKKGTMKNLYKEDAAATAKTISTTQKPVIVEKAIEVSDFSRGKIEEKVTFTPPKVVKDVFVEKKELTKEDITIEPEIITETKELEIPTVEVKNIPETTGVKEDKEFSPRIFSRGSFPKKRTVAVKTPNKKASSDSALTTINQ
jgi:hypothetical protein